MAKKILLVDDSEAVRKSVAFILRQNGFETDEAADGVEGVAKATAHTYDLIITDINMPNKDGFGLMRDVRALPQYKFKPILVLTTESELSKINEGKELGATGWLVKPFDGAKLLATLARILK
jgi:two-component system chemotaxis response regulator CheY